ncbi:MAG TPA: zf-HC2 domain-containing protein [Roseiflexaceae bacterium]|nr:zf-HC2 domain-containing protein [Roseiflexaceae bacterium]
MEELDRRLERLAYQSLSEDECPEADLLAAYMLGDLSGNSQLSVAAHVRGCPLCQRDLAVCQPLAPRPRTLVARLLPPPLLAGRRSSATAAQVRQYVAADLSVDLTIAPPSGDEWRLTGQVLRGGAGQADLPVLLRSGRRSYRQTSDNGGFFTFQALPPGRYTLSVTDTQVLVQIRNLDLTEE